jgi:hypothetical protein
MDYQVSVLALDLSITRRLGESPALLCPRAYCFDRDATGRPTPSDTEQSAMLRVPKNSNRAACSLF